MRRPAVLVIRGIVEPAFTGNPAKLREAGKAQPRWYPLRRRTCGRTAQQSVTLRRFRPVSRKQAIGLARGMQRFITTGTHAVGVSEKS
jgi:hypothetical protein